MAGVNHSNRVESLGLTPYCPQSQKYSFCGPLPKMFANSCFKTIPTVRHDHTLVAKGFMLESEQEFQIECSDIAFTVMPHPSFHNCFFFFPSFITASKALLFKIMISVIFEGLEGFSDPQHVSICAQ